VPRVATASKYGRAYGIVTPAILTELFDTRMLTADLLSRSTDEREAHAARQVLLTLDALRSQIEGLIE
jgi:hypothetical protein